MFSLKLLFFSFKIDNITLDPDPNWARRQSYIVASAPAAKGSVFKCRFKLYLGQWLVWSFVWYRYILLSFVCSTKIFVYNTAILFVLCIYYVLPCLIRYSLSSAEQSLSIHRLNHSSAALWLDSAIPVPVLCPLFSCTQSFIGCTLPSIRLYSVLFLPYPLLWSVLPDVLYLTLSLRYSIKRERHSLLFPTWPLYLSHLQSRGRAGGQSPGWRRRCPASSPDTRHLRSLKNKNKN